MKPVVSSVPWSVCVCVCVCRSVTAMSPTKTAVQTDRGAVWDVDFSGCSEPCIRWGSRSDPTVEGPVWGHHPVHCKV